MAGPTMTTIIKRRIADKEEELRRVQSELNLLRSMLAEAQGEPDPLAEVAPAKPAQRARRSSVKSYVIQLLERTGSSGLNAAIAVEMATQEGKALDRGSVSSLLSRMKQDGAVIYEGDRYRLRNRSDDDSKSSADIFQHPASSRAASSSG